MTNLFNRISLIALTSLLCSIIFGQSKDYSRELKRLNAKIDRVRVMVDSLETDNQILLPELMSAFKASVKGKTAQDSITVMLLKKINNLDNRMRQFENQKTYSDSVNNEILNRLLFVENKIVTLTSSFNEMAKLKSGEPISNEPQFNSAQYKKTYMASLGHFQSQNFLEAISGFEQLVSSDATNDLADNS